MILAHPSRLRAITEARAKTDKLDAALLAKLLRADLIPKSYIPPRSYAQLRELTRAWNRLSRHETQAKNELHALFGEVNMEIPFLSPFSQKSRQWMIQADIGPIANLGKTELLSRIAHLEQSRAVLDVQMGAAAKQFPQVQALLDIRSIGLYTALVIIGEFGEPKRFRDGWQVAAYPGLTPRVRQSGDRAYYGGITRQGSSLLRWVLVQAAMKANKNDPGLANFYLRIRKRSSAKIARVAFARKLEVISWVRLRRWERVGQTA